MIFGKIVPLLVRVGVVRRSQPAKQEEAQPEPPTRLINPSKMSWAQLGGEKSRIDRAIEDMMPELMKAWALIEVHKRRLYRQTMLRMAIQERTEGKEQQ